MFEKKIGLLLKTV